MAENTLNWSYKRENYSYEDRPDWHRVFETVYENQPVKVEVREGVHPILRNMNVGDSLITLFIYNADKTDYVGLVYMPIIPFFFSEPKFVFLKPLKEGGQKPMDPSEAPRLEDFVRQYKPIFESQRDLREVYSPFF